MTTPHRKKPPWGIPMPPNIDHHPLCPRTRLAEVIRRDAEGNARTVKHCLDCEAEEQP